MASHSHPHTFFFTLVAAPLIAAVVICAKTRKHTTEEELERQRRQHLTAAGRVIDGTLLGIDAPDGERAMSEDGAHALYYSYVISGVVYESSQDVRELQRFVHPEKCRLGSAVSVRYDPRNHASSMLVAESWSGLRKTPSRPALIIHVANALKT